MCMRLLSSSMWRNEGSRGLRRAKAWLLSGWRGGGPSSPGGGRGSACEAVPDGRAAQAPLSLVEDDRLSRGHAQGRLTLEADPHAAGSHVVEDRGQRLAPVADLCTH